MVVVDRFDLRSLCRRREWSSARATLGVCGAVVDEDGVARVVGAARGGGGVGAQTDVDAVLRYAEILQGLGRRVLGPGGGACARLPAQSAPCARVVSGLAKTLRERELALSSASARERKRERERDFSLSKC